MTLPDVGGFEFGGLAPQSFDTWGEGARFPMLRIAVQEAPRLEGLQLVSLNSRTPALVAQGLAAMSVVASELCDALDAAPALGDGLLGSAPGLPPRPSKGFVPAPIACGRWSIRRCSSIRRRSTSNSRSQPTGTASRSQGQIPSSRLR